MSKQIKTYGVIRHPLEVAITILLAVLLPGCHDDDTPLAPEPVGEEWIDAAFAAKLQELGLIEDALSVTPSMVADITELNISESNLSSLRGIEWFKSLEKFDCERNNLTTLCIDGLKSLRYMACPYNRQLTTLSAKGCVALDYLDFANCNVSEIDIADCTGLTELGCGNNELESIDVTGFSNLERLYCYGNYLETIDLSGCPQLQQLISFDNLLEGLDITVNRKLTMLYTMINPGHDGKFIIRAWFGNDDVPDNFSSGSWTYEDKVTVEYIKAV
ncbi:MAG: hypothetical protein J6C77_01220 [Muribaculaceae bacterium]|nr:hypothetical protein [Muribaculaceae bacterium]